MSERWTAEDERNLAADRLVLKKLRDRGEEPSQWLLDEHDELTRRKKAAKVRRPKGEGGIYQRADGLWCAVLELPNTDGKRRRKVLARKDRADVVKELNTLKRELAKHGNLATNSYTVAKWMEHWLKDVPDGTEMLSSTYTLLGHNVLSTALKVAHREGLITANVCEMVDRPRARVTQQKALTLEQAVQLLQHLATRADGPLWATYLLTGARRGEILGLEAERVTGELDLSWQLQRIKDISKAPADWEYRELGGTLYLTRPKSSAGWRVIPLVEPLKSIIALQVGDQEEGLVFTRNGKPWDPDRATKEWNKLLAEAGMPEGVVLHGARHTLVDLMFEAGVHAAITQEIVGHSTVAMTNKYRSRGNSPQLTAAMSSLSKLLEQ